MEENIAGGDARGVSFFMAKRRRDITVRLVPLSSPEAASPRMGGTVDERVAAVMVLTEEAWRLAGRPFPQYTRQTIPVVRGTLQEHAPSL